MLIDFASLWVILKLKVPLAVPLSIEPRFHPSVRRKTEPRKFQGSPRTTRPRNLTVEVLCGRRGQRELARAVCFWNQEPV